MSANLTMFKAMIRSLLFLLICVPLSLSADVYYSELGKIEKLTRSHIYAGDLHYRLLPTVKVILESGKPGATDQLKKGDVVNMRILKLDGKRYVDTIRQVANQGENLDANADENN